MSTPIVNLTNYDIEFEHADGTLSCIPRHRELLRVEPVNEGHTHRIGIGDLTWTVKMGARRYEIVWPWTMPNAAVRYIIVDLATRNAIRERYLHAPYTTLVPHVLAYDEENRVAHVDSFFM